MLLNQNAMAGFMKKFIFFFYFLILYGCSTTNFYLVRHAEKMDNSKDPDLSATGKGRAVVLKDSLMDEKIDYLYASQYKRTQQTVKPLADALGKEVIIYDAGSTFDIVEKLKLLKNNNAVVAGHSNTVPEMVLMFTGDTVQIGHDEYHHMFLVRKKKNILGEKYELETINYGSN